MSPVDIARRNVIVGGDVRRSARAERAASMVDGVGGNPVQRQGSQANCDARAAVGLAAIAMLLLVAGAVVSGILAVRATEAAGIANGRLEVVIGDIAIKEKAIKKAEEGAGGHLNTLSESSEQVFEEARLQKESSAETPDSGLPGG